MTAIIAYRNDADTATLTGTAQAGYPLSNLQLRQLSERTRLALANNMIVVDLGVSKRIRLVALLGVNVDFGSGNATKVEYGSSASGPWTNVPVTWPGDASAAHRAGSSKDVSPALYCTIPAGLSARYWRITCAWPRIGAAAYYEIGRLWIGDALVLPTGVDGDWGVGAIDAGKLDFSAGLQGYEDPRPRARVVSCSISGIGSDLAFGFAEDALSTTDVPSLQALQQEAGATGDVILLPRISTPLWMRRLGVYGHMAEIPTVRKLAGPQYAAELRVIEER